MTLSQTHTHAHTHTHTHFCSPGCLCNPRTSCLLCSPVFHDQFILPACSFPSSPTPPSLPLSVFPPPALTLFLSPSFLLLFFPRPAHLTPYFSLICPPFPPANSFTRSRPLTIHLLIICQDAALCCQWLDSPSHFYTLFSCHRPPVGFFTLPLHLSFIASPSACTLIPCLFPLSHF